MAYNKLPRVQRADIDLHLLYTIASLLLRDVLDLNRTVPVSKDYNIFFPRHTALFHWEKIVSVAF